MIKLGSSSLIIRNKKSGQSMRALTKTKVSEAVSIKCRLQTADCKLQTGYKMQTRYKMQTADCRLGIKCRLISKPPLRQIQDTF